MTRCNGSLQRRKGNPRTKNSGWRDRSFCRTRDTLLRCIREYCGEVDAEALSQLKSLPDWHPDWDRRSQRTNLDVRGTSRAQVNTQSRALGVSEIGGLRDMMIARLALALPLLLSLLAVRCWSKMLSMSARDTTPIAPLMGEDQNSIIQVKTETQKDKGDSVTFSLLARLAGDGYSEGQTAVGNAEAMTLYAQSAVINEIGHVCSPPSQNSIDHQPIPFQLRGKACSACGSASAGQVVHEHLGVS